MKIRHEKRPTHWSRFATPQAVTAEILLKEMRHRRGEEHEAASQSPQKFAEFGIDGRSETPMKLFGVGNKRCI